MEADPTARPGRRPSAQPTAEERPALGFAWRVCKAVKSNAIVLAQGRQLVGVGAGQMSRLDSVRIAVAQGGREGPGGGAGLRRLLPLPRRPRRGRRGGRHRDHPARRLEARRRDPRRLRRARHGHDPDRPPPFPALSRDEPKGRWRMMVVRRFRPLSFAIPTRTACLGVFPGQAVRVKSSRPWLARIASRRRGRRRRGHRRRGSHRRPCGPSRRRGSRHRTRQSRPCAARGAEPAHRRRRSRHPLAGGADHPCAPGANPPMCAGGANPARRMPRRAGAESTARMRRGANPPRFGAAGPPRWLKPPGPTPWWTAGPPRSSAHRRTDRASPRGCTACPPRFPGFPTPRYPDARLPGDRPAPIAFPGCPSAPIPVPGCPIPRFNPRACRVRERRTRGGVEDRRVLDAVERRPPVGPTGSQAVMERSGI